MTKENKNRNEELMEFVRIHRPFPGYDKRNLTWEQIGEKFFMSKQGAEQIYRRRLGMSRLSD